MKTLIDREGLIFSPPQLGCVLYLPGLPGGDSKIYDRSPYGNIGTITGATWKRLPSGLWCLSFDGTDDYVGCGNATSLQLTDKFSVEFWAKVVSGNEGVIAGKWYQAWEIKADATNFNVYVGMSVEPYWKNLDSKAHGVDITEWNHWAYVFDYTGGKVYFHVNGVYVNSEGWTNLEVQDNTKNVEIGRRSGGGNDFEGSVALLRIHNRGVSALEIQNHFNQEKHLFGVW